MASDKNLKSEMSSEDESRKNLSTEQFMIFVCKRFQIWWRNLLTIPLIKFEILKINMYKNHSKKSTQIITIVCHTNFHIFPPLKALKDFFAIHSTARRCRLRIRRNIHSNEAWLSRNVGIKQPTKKTRGGNEMISLLWLMDSWFQFYPK